MTEGRKRDDGHQSQTMHALNLRQLSVFWERYNSIRWERFNLRGAGVDHLCLPPQLKLVFAEFGAKLPVCHVSHFLEILNDQLAPALLH